jgi:hypothetical protein
MAQAQLIAFSWKTGSDFVHVQAMVDDAVQIAPATAFDPPEFASAACEAVVLWDNPISPANEPTHNDIERMLPWIDDWSVIPPISFDD